MKQGEERRVGLIGAALGLTCLIMAAAPLRAGKKAPNRKAAGEKVASEKPLGRTTDTAERTEGLRFEISYSGQLSAGPIDGRIYLLLSTDGKREPRLEIGENVTKTQQIFGVEVNGLSRVPQR
jgi:hypothetical protein